MIMSGKKTTVITGEASLIITELAAILDRIISEISTKSSQVGTEIEYDRMVEKFINIVQAVREIREEDPDMHPQAIIDSGLLDKAFTENFFNLKETRRVKDISSETDLQRKASSASDMLAEAMAKLNKAKEAKETQETQETKEAKKKVKKAKKKSKKDK